MNQRAIAGTDTSPGALVVPEVIPSLLAALSNNLRFTPKAEPVRLDGHFEWDQSRGDPAQGSSGDRARAYTSGSTVGPYWVL